jgi:hypothetical protein
MKKVMFFLAVIVAVGSAFTTKPLSDQNWFRLDGSALPNTTVYSTSGTSQGNYNFLNTYVDRTPIAIETAESSCPDESGLVCAARIPSFTGGTNASQLDQQDLNALSTNVPSAIVFVQP